MNFIFNLFKMMNIFQKKKSNMNTILVPKTPINSPKKEEENKMEEEDEDVNEIKKSFRYVNDNYGISFNA